MMAFLLNPRTYKNESRHFTLLSQYAYECRCKYAHSHAPTFPLSFIKGVTFRRLSLRDRVKVKLLSARSSLICDLTHFREGERERLRCQAYYAGMRSNLVQLPELSTALCWELERLTSRINVTSKTGWTRKVFFFSWRNKRRALYTVYVY